MESKVILDLCGGTGSWSSPYRLGGGGYSVKVITLPTYDIFQTELSVTGEIIFYNRDSEKFEPIKANSVYGIFAAPTCTMFSLARTTAKTPRDFNEGMELVRKCLDIIWFCRATRNSTLKFWALENPMGYLRQFLGRPPLTFDPCDYGDNYTKKTDIWGYFNLPRQKKRVLTAEEIQKCKINNRDLPPLPDEYTVPSGWNKTAAQRSMTSGCFAKAFYAANK